MLFRLIKIEKYIFIYATCAVVCPPVNWISLWDAVPAVKIEGNNV